MTGAVLTQSINGAYLACVKTQVQSQHIHSEVVTGTCNTSTQRQRQENEAFNITLGYIGSSRTAWTT